MIYLAIRRRRTTPRPRPPRFVRVLRIFLIAAALCPVSFLVRAYVRAKSATAIHPAQAARLSEQVSLHAVEPHDPTINLSDGYDLLTAYAGPDQLRIALEQNQAESLSLASADFDEDGVPDLVSGYSHDGQGIITLLRGNVDAIYPNAPDAQQRRANGTFTDAPFLSPASVFAAPVAAEFIGAGDFDADGHWDVVVASSSSRSLQMLSGDGQGNLRFTRQVSLSGVVTALTTGEINRADGLVDIVVGFTNANGSALIVFEGPEGALGSTPEVFPVMGSVATLALGQLDEGYEMDLAAGVGEQLVIVHGRDRKLSSGNEPGQTVQPAKIETRFFASAIKSIAIGDFAGSRGPALALLGQDGTVRTMDPHQKLSLLTGRSLPLASWDEQTLSPASDMRARAAVRAKFSSASGDDLIVLDQSQLRLMPGDSDAALTPTTLAATTPPAAVLPMRLNADALTDLVVLQKGMSSPALVQTQSSQVFVVNSTADTDDGQCTTAANGCTLREAINAANANAGADSIHFNIPGPAPFTINVTGQAGDVAVLPRITDSVTIDGTSQPAFTGTPIIEINGTNGGNNPILRLDAGSCTIRGLVINRSGTFGIYLNEVSGVTLEGNYVGTDTSGSVALGNAATAVNLFSSSNNTIGGLTSSARNIISGNKSMGLAIFHQSSANRVEGNYIGTDVTGTLALGNETGVQIEASSNNSVGGVTAGARNVISANEFGGIQFDNPNAEATSNNLIEGNYIGTDVSGTLPLGNGTYGVIFDLSNNNTIGGLVSGARNIISNNRQTGILLMRSTDNDVQGNYIGTAVTGAVAIGNARQGIFIVNSSRNLIGGDTLSARNVISGNGEAGISLYGGPAAGAGPFESLENKIQGNFVGTNATGTAKLSNSGDGIQLTIVNSGANNTIGGSSSGMRNLISGNGGNGIAVGIRLNDPNTGQTLAGTGGTGITVQNNYIGTDVSGNNCLGNMLDGLFVDADSFDNVFRDNLITCNGRNGVFIPQNSNPGVRIFLDNNSIFANSSLGIDLGLAGITANDPLDTDTGANFQQNFPALTSISPVTNSDKPDLGIDALTINGTLNSAPNQTFTVHWYFSSGQCTSNQAGNHPLVTGKVPGVSTNGNGDAQFSFPFDFPNGVNDGIINCTATDGQGNTSEFSSCFSVNAAAAPPSVGLDAPSYSAAENVGVKTINVTRVGSTAASCSVNYTTSDTAGASPCDSFNTGKASSRCDYETTLGTLKFAAGETSKTISIPVIDDAYNEGNEALTITLSNPVNVSLGTQSTAPVTIIDDSTPAQNPINDPTFFTKLHYFDFLNREADTPGLNFWRNEITSCGSDATCTEVHRISVSASFFLSIEFKETGYLVERAYKASYGDIEKDSSYPPPVHKLKVPIIRFQEFLADTQQITEGVVVLAPGWEQKLESNKIAFFADFVQRSRFTTALPTTLTPAQFIDQLNTNAGNVLSASERTTAINLFGGAGNTTNTTARAQALRQVAEDTDLATAEFNRAFVLMQYYGYLRRNPDDPPEATLDYAGYEFWLIKLNLFAGDYGNAEMVKAFLSSIEYNRRFGP
jgi:CSLREA domain-containing protein